MATGRHFNLINSVVCNFQTMWINFEIIGLLLLKITNNSVVCFFIAIKHYKLTKVDFGM